MTKGNIHLLHFWHASGSFIILMKYVDVYYTHCTDGETNF